MLWCGWKSLQEVPHDAVAPVSVLAATFPIQLPPGAPAKAAAAGMPGGAPAAMWEIQEKLRAGEALG